MAIGFAFGIFLHVCTSTNFKKSSPLPHKDNGQNGLTSPLLTRAKGSILNRVSQEINSLEQLKKIAKGKMTFSKRLRLTEALSEVNGQQCLQFLAELNSPVAKEETMWIQHLLIKRASIFVPEALLAYSEKEGIGEYKKTQILSETLVNSPSYASTVFSIADEQQRESLVYSLSSATPSKGKPLQVTIDEVNRILTEVANGEEELESWKEIAVRSVVAAYSKHNPNTAIEYALHSIGGKKGESLANALMLESVAGNFDADANWLPQDIAQSSDSLQLRASMWASSDPELALEWINTLNGSKRNEALKSGINSLMHELPFDALTYYNELPSSERSKKHAEILTRSLASLDPETALQFAEANNPEGLSAVFEEWANVTPDAALKTFLESEEYSKAMPDMVERIFSKLAEEDLNAARSSIDALASDDHRNSAIKSIASTWAAYDPISAVEFATSHDGIGLKDSLGIWAESDWNSALDWATNNALYSRSSVELYNEILSNASYEHIDQAAQVVSDILESEESLEPSSMRETLWAIGEKLLETEPRAAIHWIEGLPPSAATETGLAISKQWAAIDPLGVSEWLSGLDPGPLLDAGIQGLLPSIADDHERSIQWANIVNDPELRKKLIGSINAGAQ